MNEKTYSVLDMKCYDEIESFWTLDNAIGLANALPRGFIMSHGHVIYCTLACSPKNDSAIVRTQASRHAGR